MAAKKKAKVVKTKVIKAKKEAEHPLAKVILVGSITLFILGLIKKFFGIAKTSK